MNGKQWLQRRLRGAVGCRPPTCGLFHLSCCAARLTAGGCGVKVAHILAQHGGQVLVPHVVHLPHTCKHSTVGHGWRSATYCCGRNPLQLHKRQCTHGNGKQRGCHCILIRPLHTCQRPGCHLEVGQHKGGQTKVEEIQRVLCDLNTQRGWAVVEHVAASRAAARCSGLLQLPIAAAKGAGMR